MVFKETSGFTQQVTDLLSDDEYAELQSALVANPELGDKIKGTGGLRKVRWASTTKGKGKRGGVRVIYYWLVQSDQIAMMFMYGKDEQDELTSEQRKRLKELLETL
jgi:mRNA-degrading endonuclease RelE of RelBE toxin-antitoxin system